MKQFSLNFNGYWRETKKDSIPEVTGVYLVYRCVYNETSKTVTLKELIYIGKSVNVNRRVADHSRAGDFVGALDRGEELCYSVAEVGRTDLSLVENALIFAQQPKLNEQGKESFAFADSSFIIGGRCALLRYTSFNITSQ